MAIVERKIPHEILIRFASGQEHEVAAPGDFSGAHYSMITQLVDEETGAVKHFVIEPAQALARDKITEFFGSHVADVAAGLSAAEKDRDSLRTDLERATAELDQVKSQRDSLNEALKLAVAELTAIHANKQNA